MALSFYKMSFSQVSHFVDMLKTYLSSSENDNNKEEMESTSSLDVSMQSVENEDEGTKSDMSGIG